MDGAGAALSDTAAELRAGHAQRIAQHPKERRLRLDIDVDILAVDLERKHRRPPSPNGQSSARIGPRSSFRAVPKPFRQTMGLKFSQKSPSMLVGGDGTA